MAARSSLLENISKFIDSLLQLHVLKITMYIQDTRDFIRKVELTSIPENEILLTVDVVSLYTSIPHKEIRMVIQTYLERDQSLSIPTHFALGLIDLLLEKNYFRFKDSFYYQTKGVSMGSSFVPSVAKLFMAKLEEQFVLNRNQNLFFDDICIF